MHPKSPPRQQKRSDPDVEEAFEECYSSSGSSWDASNASVSSLRRSTDTGNTSLHLIDDVTNAAVDTSALDKLMDMLVASASEPRAQPPPASPPRRPARTLMDIIIDAPRPEVSPPRAKPGLTLMDMLLGPPVPSAPRRPAPAPPLLLPISVPYHTNIRLSYFTLGRVLGKGSFGRVHHIQSRFSGKYYALKIISKQRCVSRKQVAHTNEEARLLRKVSGQCPFVISTQHVFQNDTNLYLMLDYVPGGELFGLLMIYKRLSEPVVRFYASEILLALEYLHGSGIMFRDLKPENVLIGGDGHVVLTDFGFATQAQLSSTLCGTHEYLAPEIIRAQIHGFAYGCAVDYWALGVLIFELLMGTPPFHDPNQSVNNLHLKILAGFSHIVWPPTAQFTEEAFEVMDQLMDSSPSRRMFHVRRLRWFDEMDWRALEMKMVRPPWLPSLGGMRDTSNFSADQPEAAEEEVSSGQDAFGYLFPEFPYVSPEAI